MVRKRLWHAVVAMSLFALPVAAQLEQEEAGIPELPLEEILDNYYEAIGGEDAWLDIESTKMTGTMVMGPGMEAPFTIYQRRPDQLRLEFTFQGMTGVQAIDGEQAWQLMPFMGKTEPEQMPDELADQMREQVDIEGALVNWSDKGHSVELLGVGQAQGTDAYKVKVTLASGREQVYYLDSEAFVPFLMETTTSFQGNEIQTEQIFSDYKEVDGLMMPHSLENRVKGQPGGQTITVESVEFGVDMNEVEFAMPEAAESEAAE